MESELSDLLLKIYKISKSGDKTNLEENRNKLLYKLCDAIKADERLLDEIKIKYKQRGKKVTALCVTCDNEFKDFVIDNMSVKAYKKTVGHDHVKYDALNVILLCEIEDGLMLDAFIELSYIGL